jgi:transposase
MLQSQNGTAEQIVSETEVVVKAKRRQYTAEYKLRIIKEIENCQGNGDIGAVLRREGVYSSMLNKWKEQRDSGSLDGL